MIIVPEIETVVILTPRTGSGSLKDAIAKTYAQSMLVYRHMEADGVPHGYDRWRRVGVVRDPTDRLWSLYKFLKTFNGNHDNTYIEDMRKSVELPFSEWVCLNETVFTSPYDRAKRGRFFPNYTVNHAQPENWKSQFTYLRPDLGTEIWKFADIHNLARSIGVRLGHKNSTVVTPKPEVSPEARRHIEEIFAWDLEAVNGEDS
jgi:hypothetical protein